MKALIGSVIALLIGFFLGTSLSTLRAQEGAGLRCVDPQDVLERGEGNAASVESGNALQEPADSGCEPGELCVFTSARLLRPVEVNVTDCR
jgi:hypothetical protein